MLLNRSHQFHDLVLFVDRLEKKIFDTIDGRRSITEILDIASIDTKDAPALFQRLWWYDQVAFDVSSAY